MTHDWHEAIGQYSTQLTCLVCGARLAVLTSDYLPTGKFPFEALGIRLRNEGILEDCDLHQVSLVQTS